MSWQPYENNQKRCTDHEVVFPKTMSCPQCKPGLGAPASAIAPVTTDKELDLLESELRAEARFFRKLGREPTEGTDRDVILGIKAAELALKYDRAYKEILTDRKSREHDQWLVEQNRLLQGSGEPH